MLTVTNLYIQPPVQGKYYVLSDEQRDCRCIIDQGCYFGNERAARKDVTLSREHLSPVPTCEYHANPDPFFGVPNCPNKMILGKLPLHLHEN